VDDRIFTILFVVIFILAPIIERVLKAGRGAQTPQRPPPGQRRPLPGPPAPPQRRELPDRTRTPLPAPRAETPQEAQKAADLIPADLWELLTGQKQAPQPAPPVPAPLPQRPPPVTRRTSPVDIEEDEEAAAGIENRSLEAQPGTESAAAEELLRRRERATEQARRVVHPPPVIMSLETEPLGEPSRHKTFHEKADHLPLAARVTVAPTPLLSLDPNDRATLRRAFILQEVLGKPKSLE
jgi:hypothetical protein